MRIYKGPDSKHFNDNSHELVSEVSSQALRNAIETGDPLKFDVTKQPNKRLSVCTAYFDDEDLIPMLEGAIYRLRKQKEALEEIKNTLRQDLIMHSIVKTSLSPEKRLESIKAQIEESLKKI